MKREDIVAQIMLFLFVLTIMVTATATFIQTELEKTLQGFGLFLSTCVVLVVLEIRERRRILAKSKTHDSLMKREDIVTLVALFLALEAVIITSFLSAYQHTQGGLEGVKLFVLSCVIFGVLSIRLYRRIVKKKNKEVLR